MGWAGEGGRLEGVLQNTPTLAAWSAAPGRCTPAPPVMNSDHLPGLRPEAWHGNLTSFVMRGGWAADPAAAAFLSRLGGRDGVLRPGTRRGVPCSTS